MSPVSKNLVPELLDFFKHWQESYRSKDEGELLAQSLTNFFMRWSSLPVFEPEIVEETKFELKSFHEFINNYKHASTAIDEVRKTGFHLNVWKTAGIGSDEVRNSKVLKWLLDCHGDHGQGSIILERMLDSLSIPSFTGRIPHSYTIKAESYPLGDNLNRVDIELNLDNILIFIEVKINASEGVEQLKRYKEVAVSKANGKAIAIIYLTRKGDLPVLYREDEVFIPLSWKKLAEILNRYAMGESANNRAAWLISQYARHIKNFYN